MKAFIEIDLPESCHNCPIRFIHEDIDENEVIGCGYLNTDVTEYTESRHRECPLKTADYNGYIGYEDYIRIGNEIDAIRLIEDMIEKCGIKSHPDHNDTEKGLYMIVETVNAYFLPRLEALKDALERGII
jgi:hypothetical protein